MGGYDGVEILIYIYGVLKFVLLFLYVKFFYISFLGSL